MPEANIMPGTQTVSALLAGDGYYTVVVRRQDVTNVAQVGSYTLTIGANVAGGIPPAPVDWRGQQAARRELLPEDGIVTFSPESAGTTTLRVFADSLRSIQVERSLVLELAGTSGTLSWVREFVREAALLDGSLSIYLNNGGFVYIADYAASGRDTFTDAFSNFTLQNDGRAVRGIDWNTVQNLWLLPGCMGYELADGGRHFIAEGTSLNVSERPAASGGIGQNITMSGGTAPLNLTIDWQEIDRVLASGGLIDAELTGNRFLRLDRLNITISQPPDASFTVTEPNNLTLLRTDWANIRRVEVVGDLLRVVVDDLRDTVERRGRILRTLETRDGTMRALWQDDTQSLLLTEAEDFIEIDTSAALPDYVSGLQPLETDETGAVGFLPANLNNAGQECFPVNTILDLNCAANGEVNPANGGLSLSVTDLFARGARLDLILSRTYNSHNAQVDGPFGRGWSTDYLLDYGVDYAASQQARRVTPHMSYPAGLDVTYAPLGLVIYTTASGSRHVFERKNDGWRSGTMPGWLIALRTDPLLDDWHLARDDGTIYEFDRAGRLRRIRHIYGGALEIEREAFTLTDPDAVSVYRIADDTGRSLRLTFDGDMHITLTELYDGDRLLDSVTYDYNAAGLLVAVRYGDGAQARYEYTESGRLSFHDDPRAPLAQRLYYGYDEAGRVIWVDPNPATTPEQCSADPRPFRCYAYASGSGQLTTTVTDEWGRVTGWTYSVTSDPDTAFRLLSRTEPDGTQTTYSYGSGDLARFPVSYSRAGLQHQLRWESFGRPTALQADSWINFSATYSTSTRLDIDGDGTPEYALPLLESYRTDGDSGPRQPVRYSYDPASGQPVSMTDSAGLVTRIDEREDRFGLPTLVTQEGGETAAPQILSYDGYGFLASRQDETGTDRYTWDVFGRITRYERVSRMGEVLVSYDVSYAPNDEGRCMTVTDPLGTQTTACYDHRERLIRQTITDSAGSRLEETTYSYDEFDRLLRVTNMADSGNPAVTAYAYTTANIQAAGNRRVIETRPDGTQQIIEYDAVDRVARVIDALGQATTYEYPAPTAAAETVIQRAPGGAETTFVYNRARQLIGLDYGPVEWGLLYGGSRAAVQREPSQIVLNTGQGASTTIEFNSYDSAGRLTQASFIIRHPDDTNVEREPVRSDNTRADMTLRYAYDPFGRLLSVENPVTGEATRLSYAVNESGERSVTVDNGQPITYTYDALDRLLRVESAAGSVAYDYRYNNERSLLEVSVTFVGADGAQADWLLAYDSLGNLREWRNEEGRTTIYEYDAGSRLVYVAHVDASGGETPVAEYTYNSSDQVTSIINRDGQQARYVYNSRGQLTTRRDFDGVVTTFLYDTRGNLQAVSDGLGYTTTYTYDNRQRLTSITDPIGREVRFDWRLGNIGELRASSDLLGETRYYFDLFSRLWQIQDAQNNRHLLRYNFGGQVSDWREAGGTLALGFTYGPGGVLAGISGPDNWRWTYGYNELGQLVERIDPDGGSLQFSFDRLGRLTSLTDPGGYTRLYERPAPGQLLLTEGDRRTAYTYDLFYRLVQETSGSAVTEYDYRDDGYTVTDPFGVISDYIYSGTLGDPDIPSLIVEQYSPQDELFREHHYAFNLRGELTGIERYDYFPDTSLAYRTWERIDYDAVGRPIRFIDGENNLYAYSYDLAGRLNTTQNPDGGIYSYEYDLLNRLTGLVNPTGQRLRLSYNPLGYLTGISLNETALENYTYSPLGWLLSRSFASYPDGAGQVSYSFSAGGVPGGWTIGDGRVTLEHSADAFHRLTGVIDEMGGAQHSYLYDASGQLISAGDQQFAYDSFGRLASAVLDGDIVNYSYGRDADTGLDALTISLPDNQTLRILIDEFRHIQRAEAGGVPVDVQYDPTQLEANILEARLRWAGRYTALVRFNHLGHILLIQYRDDAGSQQLQRFAYTRNYAGLPLAIDDRENSILVGYDNVFRPLTTSWLVTAGLRQRDSVDYAFTLAYDGQGNRSRELLQSADGSLTEIIYSYQGGLLRSRTAVTQAALSGAALIGIVLLALRRRRSILLSAVAIGVMAAGLLLVRAQPTPAYTYRYNDAGHLASITDLTAADEPVVTSFAYDGFGRLLSITVGEETTSFEYDALGRLIATESPGGRVEYRYNGRQLVGLNDGAERAVIGLLADQYLLLTGPEGSRWSLYDAPAGNRQSFLDEHTSSPSAANRFDILGRALGEDIQPGTPLALPMFNGMLYNAQHNLYIGLDGRAYDPAVGRYLQRSLTGPDAAGNLYN
ncbi:MAG TPA: DUF6531 domain-containing protein, partial [Spirillospora sp.]|nr:DUF6531 domain-containing protein [Spirillospora sp.]